MTILKTFNGYSGSRVLLMQDGNLAFVRKFGQNDRNLERLDALRGLGISMPAVLTRQHDHYDMEYIRHHDMVTWLSHNTVDGFTSWLLDVISRLGAGCAPKDYTSTYAKRLLSPGMEVWFKDLPFSGEDLFDRLPKILPSSQYHGDLTMDNCLHGTDGRFYLIDPLTSDYDSYLFDIAKLMQDLECGWFVRNRDVMLGSKIWAIRSALLSEHPELEDPTLLILMLLRILPYARSDEDSRFLAKEMARLWMS